MNSDLTISPEVNVSVIVVNYNCGLTLDFCINSILNSRAVAELILVDNASKDQSMDKVKKCTDQRLKIIQLSKNIGLAGARNLAASKATGNYLAFTDADIIVDLDWLQEPCSLLQDYNRIGVVQCKIVPSKLTEALCKEAKSGNKGNQIVSTEKPYFILFPIGAGFVVRRDVWDHIHGFDADFFVGNDDVDFGMRIWLSGYQVLCCTGAIIYHEFGTLRSRQNIAPIFQFYGYRNMLSIWTKNFEKRTIVKHVLPFSLPYLFMAFWHGGIAGVAGILSFLRNFSSVLAKRHEVQPLRRRSDKEIMSLIYVGRILPIQMIDSDIKSLYLFLFRGKEHYETK